MKLENQVCDLDQAKKLKELGLLQNYGYLQWVDGGQQGVRLCDFDGRIVIDEAPFAFLPEYVECYTAFTVAELGQMLPDWSNSYRTNPGEFTHRYICEGPKDRERQGDTEAEARAAMLIYLLENNHLTPEEANQRLAQS